MGDYYIYIHILVGGSNNTGWWYNNIYIYLLFVSITISIYIYNTIYNLPRILFCIVIPYIYIW
jgi:hypothetical protein